MDLNDHIWHVGIYLTHVLLIVNLQYIKVNN